MTAKSPPWPPPIRSQDQTLHSINGAWVSPVNGKVQRWRKPGTRWLFGVEFGTMSPADARRWTAFLGSCQDQSLTFYWSPYPLGRPQNYPDGVDDADLTMDSTAITGDSTVFTSDSGYGYGTPRVRGPGQTGRSLNIYGLMAGAQFVRGDHFAVDNDRYRELHVLTADVTANSSGETTFVFSPPLRWIPRDGYEIYLDGHAPSGAQRCAAEVMVASNAEAGYAMDDYQASMSFKLIEALR